MYIANMRSYCLISSRHVLLFFFGVIASTTANKVTVILAFHHHYYSTSRRISFSQRTSSLTSKAFPRTVLFQQSNLDSSGETIGDNYGAHYTDFPGGCSSTFQGAGLPRLELQPEDIPPLLMEALQNNDIPDVDAGLKSMWEFASGTTRFIFDYNRTDFIGSAHDTAEQWPTSFYGVAMNGRSWEMETNINRVGGEDGWIATQVMKTISSDGRMRRWQWELRKNRRPPNQGLWLVESIGSSDSKGQFEEEAVC